MMYKIGTFLFILCVIVKVNVRAQSSGYMGKRFSAGYGFYASPGFVGSSGITKINMLHEGFIEVAARKNMSIGVSTRGYHAVYGNSREIEVYGLTPYTSQSSYRQNPTGNTYIKARNYMLYFKFFRKNYLAPWGKYYILGVTLNTLKATYDPDQMYLTLSTSNSSYENSSFVYYSNFGFTEQSVKQFDITIGRGRSRIIANRLIIDYGYNINIIAMSAILFDPFDDDLPIGDETDASNYIKKVSAARIRGVNRFNIFCKVGILLF